MIFGGPLAQRLPCRFILKGPLLRRFPNALQFAKAWLTRSASKCSRRANGSRTRALMDVAVVLNLAMVMADITLRARHAAGVADLALLQCQGAVSTAAQRAVLVVGPQSAFRNRAHFMTANDQRSHCGGKHVEARKRRKLCGSLANCFQWVYKRQGGEIFGLGGREAFNRSELVNLRCCVHHPELEQRRCACKVRMSPALFRPNTRPPILRSPTPISRVATAPLPLYIL